MKRTSKQPLLGEGVARGRQHRGMCTAGRSQPMDQSIGGQGVKLSNCRAFRYRLVYGESRTDWDRESYTDGQGESCTYGIGRVVYIFGQEVVYILGQEELGTIWDREKM